MRSKMTIAGIVVAILLGCLGILAALMATLGPWRGLLAGAAIAAAVLLVYRFVIGPWQRRWGATDEEVRRAMPGDELIEGGNSTTRAITIDARPEEVWPWLVQIGYDRAGWYSYDWIDNDGRASADHIVPELQDLKVGDRITMVPGMGPTVRAMDPGRWLLSGDEDTGTWCLEVRPTDDGRTRLVSRWRQNWPITPATAFWILVADPGAFIMERKMLKGIKWRAELSAAVPVTTAA